MQKRDNFTNWTLMHKNIPVANLEMMEMTGTIVNITNTLNIEHTPVGTLDKTQAILNKPPQISLHELNDWLTSRSIPASRQNLDQLFQGLRIINAPALALKSYGLSLSDQYWLKPDNINLPWESVNFFQNEFSDDIGEVLFQNKNATPDTDVNSPDNSSDGVLQKRWKIQNEKRILVKGGDGPFGQQPFNEEIASNIMSRLGITHTPYRLGFIKGKPYSLCENFIDENTELITAWRVQNTMLNHTENKYQHLLKCCESLGIGDMTRELEQMMVVDYIIANTDRHWGNFGFIRDANTLEYKSFAPIYDSGASLWDKDQDIEHGALSKPFKLTHNQQIKLVKDLSWYEPIPKKELTEILTSTLAKNKRMSEERIINITKVVSKKIDLITELKKELSSTVIL